MRAFSRQPPATAVGEREVARSGARDAPLEAERERLTERFTVMQAELGGLFYEMAIRDHVRMEILMSKAAALQRVDGELAQVEHLLAGGDGGVGGHCPACGTVFARGAVFCSQCAQAVGDR
jgi:hypothetical protein